MKKTYIYPQIPVKSNNFKKKIEKAQRKAKKIQEHIIKSETLTAKGAWTKKAKAIAADADKVFAKFIKSNAGKLSLCALQSIIECSVNHQIMMVRLNSIKFD